MRCHDALSLPHPDHALSSPPALQTQREGHQLRTGLQPHLPLRLLQGADRVRGRSPPHLWSGCSCVSHDVSVRETDLIPQTESIAVLNDALAHFAPDQTQLGDQFTFFASSEEELSNVVAQLKGNPLVMSVQSAQDILPVNLAQQQQVLNSLDMEAYINQLDLLDRGLADRSLAMSQMRDLYTQFSLVQYAATLNGMAEIARESDEIQAQLREIQQTLRTLNEGQAHAAIADLERALSSLDSNLATLRQLPPSRGAPARHPDEHARELPLSLPDDRGQVHRESAREPRLQSGEQPAGGGFASSISHDYFGLALGIKVLENYMRRDFVISTILAAALIALVLWFTLRGWMRPLLAAAPLVLGYAWMLGGMRLLKIPFNFINITISPLLIGFGVDNGVYLLVRYAEERRVDPAGAVERSARTTAAAVIMTSLTTLSVFGSLLLARTPGLRVLGICAILGIGFALLFSLLFLPAALRVERGKRV